MKKWTNRNLPGALHFVTGVVRNRRRIFSNPNHCVTFLKEMQELRRTRPAKLVAFVVMPDHFHLIVNPEDGNIREWTGALKSKSARAIVGNSPDGAFLKEDKESQVWQESFKALPLWSGWMIWQKIHYIHANPVKGKLCDSAKDYRWSSFKSFFGMECEELLRVDPDWWWKGDEEKLTEVMKAWDEESRKSFLEERERRIRMAEGR
jgi:putative transposase